MSIRRIHRIALIAAIAIAAPARSQVTPVQLYIIPHVGALTPATEYAQELPAPGQTSRRSDYHFNSGLALGVAAELRSTRVPFALRLDVSGLPNLSLLHDPHTAGAPFVGDATGSIVLGTATLVLQPRNWCAWTLCPRLNVGGGIKRYAWNGVLDYGDYSERTLTNQLHATLQYGAGFSLRVLATELILEVNDDTNHVVFPYEGYASRRAHDAIVSLGVAVPVLGRSRR